MADLHARNLLLAAGCAVAAGSLAAAGPADAPASLPAARAENAAVAPRAGRVAPPPGQPEAPLKAVLAAVRNDAAAALGLSAAAVGVAAVEDVVWSDGALGCARPGSTATQALDPGWRLSLTGPSGALATYHASRRGAWLLCALMEGPKPADR